MDHHTASEFRDLTGRLAFGDFTLDLRAALLFRGHSPVGLPPQQFTILATVVRQPGALVTRNELRAALWGTEAFVDFDAGLNFCIRQLRLTLGDDAANPKYIQTVPRRGYRFVAPVRDATSVEALDTVTPAAAPPDPVVPRAAAPAVPRWMPAALGTLAAVVIGLAAAYVSLATSVAASTPADSDVRIADAHAAHGFVALNDRWNFKEAETAFARALQLDPGHEVALISMSRLRAAHGRFDSALEFARRALDAHPSSLRALVTLGWTQLYSGNAAAARATCRRATELSPGPGAARRCLLNSEAELGVDHAAIWTRTLNSMARQPGTGLWFIRATMEARLGRTEAALVSLQRAFDAHEPDATFAQVDPAFVGMRSHHRFLEATARVGLSLNR